MDKKWNILVINLGSTSSKIAYCQNDEIIDQVELLHDSIELKNIKDPESLVAFYKKNVLGFLDEKGLAITEMDALAVRGIGKWSSYRHGAYLLTPQLGEDCRSSPVGHRGLYASTMIGDDLSRTYGVPAYLYDVVPTDEVPDIASICGIANYRMRIASHTLNCRAVARKAAENSGRDSNKSTFIISHLGGGFGTLVYKDGIIIDTYSAETGCFTPERAGRVPVSFVTSLFADGKYSGQDIERILKKDVGLFGHLGTSDCLEVEKRITNGDKKAKLVYEAMAYQVSKDISALGAVVCGKVDAIILTGGISKSAMLTGWIKERVSYIAQVIIMPSMEMEALAGGVARVLNGDEHVNNYEEVGERILFESLADA